MVCVSRTEDNLQRYLLDKSWNGQPIVSFDEIQEDLGVTKEELWKFKRELFESGKANFTEGEKIEIVDGKAICYLLTRKNGRLYCPKRHCYFSERDARYFCGVVQYTTSSMRKAYRNVCPFKVDTRQTEAVKKCVPKVY